MNIYSADLAKKYSDGRDNFKDADAKLFELIDKVSISGKEVLDLGCGDGRYALKFKSMNAKNVKGLDISPAMIKLAKEKYPDIEFSLGDCRELPYPDNSFDVIFSNFMLQHCENVKIAFSEIGRTLKLGGHFIGAFNSVETSNENILNSKMPILLGEKDPITVYDLMKLDGEYTDAINAASLEIMEYVDEPNAHAIIDPDFKHYSDIKKLKSIVCLLKK